MGKRLLARFSDINQRIIKRTKRDKTKSGRQISKLKRKSDTDLEEPLEKISKSEPTDIQQIHNLDKTKLNELNNDNIYVEKLQNSKDIVLKIKDNISHDLLFSDELKNSFFNLIYRDFYFHILDEIGLEGLDGITIEAFWKRFSTALEGLPHINQYIKNFIWQNVILCSNHLKFFELPVERGELQIYNRFDYMNTEIGVVLELAYKLPDIYPPKLVDNPEVLGSCSTFNERVDISNVVSSLTIQEAEEKYGLKLVIVADQNLRTFVLCGDLIDPLIEFLNTEYCFLERVGRSRKLGELTQGEMSIGSSFKMDARSIFHYKKQLYAYEVISKQFFVIKSPLFDQNKTGSLLHLRRFYTNIRTHQSFRADELINLLKKQPDYRIEIRQLRKMYSDNYNYILKLLKNPDFKKIVRLKIYPYRTLYPNASQNECKNKNKSEKLLTCYELVDPYVNIVASWRVNDHEEYDDDDDDEKEVELSGQMIYNMDIIRNVYYQIYLSGDKGCTSNDIRLSTGFDSNTTRVGLKKLCQKGVINFAKCDIGKTRKFNYTARCLKKTDEQSSNITNIESERPKISSVKTKILERQKAALAKRTQIKSNKKIEPQEKKSAYNNFLQVEKPPISDWKFLIKNYEFKTGPQTIFLPLTEDIQLSKKIEIGLTFLAFKSKQLFNINKILDEINPKIRIHSVKPNFENVYIHKYSKKCIETTILLLRATLEEINLKTELFKSESKATTSLPDLTKIKSTLEGHYAQLKLDYMGKNPLVTYSENVNNVNIQIIASTIPKAYVFEKKYVNKNNTITDRVLFRIQIILDLINEMKIIEELMKLNKLIVEVETKNGYDKKIDRKPMYRLIKRLVEEGYIKVYKLVLHNNVINKTVIFICHPSISHTDDVIQTACQQLKWKFFTSVGKKATKPQVAAVQKNLENKMGNSPFSQSDVLNSINEMNKLSKIQMKEISNKFNRKIGIVYGAKPKFTRMRVMHEFLYYLIYGYTGFPNPLPGDDIRKLFTSYCIELSDNDMKGMPNIHSDEISWKMFVPPLPIHTGWPDGWALVCDIILRFPITVLLKIHNCTFEDPELLEILNHPVKRFFLVKDLPERIRKTVLFKRKYLFSAYDTIHFLVFCGLVQFGPQKYKEKDQLFIYLNRKASLKNTTSSAPGYNEIEKKEYPLLPFYFNTHLDVEQYWQSLNTISLSTKLNSREPGKVVTLTYINTKSDIMQSIKSRTANEAILFDKGEIPGDGKGAAGLDSSLWPHLIRNWYWSSKGSFTQQSYSLYSNEILKEVPTKTMSFKDLRANVIPKFYLPPSSHKKVNKLHKKPETQKHLCRRVTKYTRVIPKRPMKLAKRVYKDDIDKKIVKKMGTRRAKWLEPEEEPVMLCKVGDIIMNGMKRYKQQVVPFTVVRDVLHRVSPMSKYKTSRAIQRYWKKMQKGPYAGLEGKVANLFKLKPINDTFVLLLKRIDIRDAKLNKPFRLTDPQISSAYIILMSYIFRNKKKILDALEGNLVNNDHLSDDHIQYTEETAVEIGKKEKKYFDAKNEFDIKRDIVKSIIHSSLCAKEVTNFSNQLFKIYQNYPDIIIKEAVKELRDTNTISYRSKRDKKANVWDTPFFLSQFYIFFQCSTFNNVSADEAFNAFTNITKHRGNSIEGTVSTVQNKRYGQLLGISEFFSFYSNIRFIFYFPQNTIMLNPEIDNHDELVNELAIRYQLKLKEGNETEMDFETENDNYRTKSNDQELIPIDEDKEISDLTEQTKSIPSDNQDTDLAVDSGNSETISRLKTWITDYIATDSERRSPSPEFIISHTEMDEDDIGSEKPLEISEKIHGEQGDVFNSRGFISTEKNLIPTLDEIKEGMLKTNINDEERTIPHITELSDLLTKHFNDLKMDTDTLLRLKNHFITEYATLDRVVINEFEHLQDHYMVQYLDNSMKNKEMWNRIENGIIVRDFLTLPNYEKLIRTSGGSDEDVELASEIIQFAANKELFGATGSELKEAFLWRENKCTLTSILKSLLEAGILLQMGIATLSFVHYKYHYAWVVERKCIALDTPSTSADLELQGAIKSVRMKIMPWVRVNGQLDKSIFKNWITNLLSYSLDFPKITFGRLCEKFCYIKPVDLYYLLQILEELGCIELFIYENKETNLFTEWSMPKERYATCLDNLEDIVIQPHNVSLTRLGSFFYNTD